MITDTQTRQSEISPRISRTWLLVSADRADDFERATESQADQIILDIEDAVDPSNKDAARQNVTAWLQSGHQAWVRVNDRSTSFWAQDLDRLREVPGLQGVILAKTETPDEVSKTHARLGGNVPVIALIESAVGVENAVAIASAHGAFRLAFGSGDYRRDTGASADELAMAYPRSRLVVASRVGRLPGPIDGPSVSPSHPLVREQSESALALGMTGRLCLNIPQVSVVNEAMSPAQSDIAWAMEFLDSFSARGGIIQDGSDLPRLSRAQKILTLAQAFALI
ncbi:CoA ester lyase [Microbacterium sp. NPDC076768]|uniref:HpcH/HpaI aldolase/citrate lyase family protein n=1 Tax=Microbacterium sp. NPDC076768 TaxID=3154858 RepID=UPI00343CBF88